MSDPAADFGDADAFDELRKIRGDVLLIETLFVYSRGATLQHQRSILDVGQHDWRDPLVIRNNVVLGNAVGRKQNPVFVALFCCAASHAASPRTSSIDRPVNTESGAFLVMSPLIASLSLILTRSHFAG